MMFENPFPEDPANDVPTPPLADILVGDEGILPNTPPTGTPIAPSVASFKAFAFEFSAVLSNQEQQAATVQAKSEQLAKDVARLDACCKALQEQADTANDAKERLAQELANLTERETATIRELQLRNDMLEKKFQARYEVHCLVQYLLFTYCYCSVLEKTHTELEEKKLTISQQNEQLIALQKKVANLEGIVVQPSQEENGMITMTKHI